MKHLTVAALIVAGSVAPGVAPAAAALSIGIGISVRTPPPPLPVYEQPPIPGPDYIWTPGHWRWSNAVSDYYWVPGTWVLAPQPGLLWTPPWWGFVNGAYTFHEGYWGPHVGYYGGVPYGHGYSGGGYEGGYWQGGHFSYNRTVNNINNSHVTNVYNRTVIVNRTTNVSYNGGPGGIAARPTPQQEAFAHERHIDATPLQVRHRDLAASDQSLRSHANHGHPPVAAVPAAASFTPARPGNVAPDARHHGRGMTPAGAPAGTPPPANGRHHGRDAAASPEQPAAAPLPDAAPGRHHGHGDGGSEGAPPAPAVPPAADEPAPGGKHHHHGEAAAAPDGGAPMPDGYGRNDRRQPAEPGVARPPHGRDRGATPPDGRGAPAGKHHGHDDQPAPDGGGKKHKHHGD